MNLNDSIAYDCKLCRPGCPLVQIGLGGTIDGYSLMRFGPDNWLLAPTPDMRVYPLTPEILEQLLAKVPT